MKFKKLSALIIALAMVVCVFSACGSDAEKETGNKENTKQTQKKDNKKGEDKATGDTKTTDGGSAPAEKEPEKNVPVDHIEEAEDIQSGDELTSLINESNDPDTSPERREEILGILGEYLEGIDGEVVSIPAE